MFIFLINWWIFWSTTGVLHCVPPFWQHCATWKNKLILLLLLFFVFLPFGEWFCSKLWNYDSHNALGDINRKYNAAMDLVGIQLESSQFINEGWLNIGKTSHYKLFVYAEGCVCFKHQDTAKMFQLSNCLDLLCSVDEEKIYLQLFW